MSPGPGTIRELASRRALLILALLGAIATSGYLSAVRLAGALPSCGIAGGCDTVALSSYSVIMGVPVAYLGLAFSTVLLGLVGAWMWLADRRLLWASYALATLGVVFVAYLTYLELFVIDAICIWCVAFAASLLAAWALLVLEMRSSLN